ncbi:Integrin beta-like protein 1, partial [Chelonia mydas]
HGKCDCGKCKCDEGWYGDACQYPTICNLTRKKSNEMCKNSQDIICSSAGICQCGRCKCENSDGNGLIYGKFCECDDRECIDDETGEICTGHGKCYCGNCYCEAGWHGDKCEFQCDITPWEIKKRCTSPDGKICSNRGTCICGECTCHDVDPTGDWGDIHGDTCECDERNCKAVYDRYSDDFCSASTGSADRSSHWLWFTVPSQWELWDASVVPEVWVSRRFLRPPLAWNGELWPVGAAVGRTCGRSK